MEEAGLGSMEEEVIAAEVEVEVEVKVEGMEGMEEERGERRSQG